MKNIIFILVLIASQSAVAECTDVAKYNEEQPFIYVICPGLPNYNDKEIGKIVYQVLTFNKFQPDEYIINFVASNKYLTESSLGKESHLGLYYTHNNEIVIWPKNKEKTRKIQLRL